MPCPHVGFVSVVNERPFLYEYVLVVLDSPAAAGMFSSQSNARLRRSKMSMLGQTVQTVSRAAET